MRLSHSLLLVVVAFCAIASFVSPVNADTLTVTGSCPGEVEFAISGFESESSVAVLMATGTGNLRIPNGYSCAGTRLGLNANRLRVIINFYTDEFGAASIVLSAPRAVCGWYTQALDIDYQGDCSTSSVVQIPGM